MPDLEFTREQLDKAISDTEMRCVAVIEEEMRRRALEAVFHWNRYYSPDHDNTILNDEQLTKLVLELSSISTGRQKYDPQKESSK